MRTLVHSLVWLFWSVLLDGQQLGECAVFVKGVVSLEPDDQYMPQTIFVDLVLNGQIIHLNLNQNPDIDPNCPVYTMSTDPAGKTKLRKVHSENSKDLAFYVDLENNAAFQATRGTHKNEPPYLEGVLYASGKTYSVKNVGMSNNTNPRSRREYEDNQVNGRHIYKEMFEVEGVFTPLVDPLDTLPDSLNYEDLVARLNSTSQSIRHRRKLFKRQEKKQIFIDILSVIDYYLYSRVYSNSKETNAEAKKSSAINELRRFQLIILNGMNMIYKTITTLPYTMHIGITSIMIVETEADSSWTVTERVPMTPADGASATNVLNKFYDWARTTKLPNYDHVMLFTGLDIFVNDSDGLTMGVEGLAQVGTVCDTSGSAVSLVEDRGSFSVIFAATHELGHGLSMRHDSENNPCPKDRHIMAADNAGYTEANKLNQWKFSSCSVEYLRTFVTNRNLTEQGRQCLWNALPRSADLPLNTSLRPGQMYPPDEQCRRRKGAGTALCVGLLKKPEDVCTYMFCTDGVDKQSCTSLASAPYTTCGNGKWCVNGECVYDHDAPSADDNCVFGDDRTIILNGKLCAEAVVDNPNICYSDVGRARCCETCAKKYRLVKDCEYGNRQVSCNKQGCHPANQEYRRVCCETCNVGSPIIPTTTSPRPPRPTTTGPTTTTTTVPSTIAGPGSRSTSSPDNNSVTALEQKWFYQLSVALAVLMFD